LNDFQAGHVIVPEPHGPEFGEGVRARFKGHAPALEAAVLVHDCLASVTKNLDGANVIIPPHTTVVSGVVELAVSAVVVVLVQIHLALQSNLVTIHIVISADRKPR